MLYKWFQCHQQQMLCSWIKALGSPVTYTERKDATNPIDITPTFLSVLYREEARAKHR